MDFADAPGSGAGDLRSLRELPSVGHLPQELLGTDTASTAVSGYPQLLPEVGKPGCPALRGGDDLAFGNGMTDTNEHDANPEIDLT